MPNNSYTLNRVLFLLYFYPIAFTLRHCSFIENSPHTTTALIGLSRKRDFPRTGDRRSYKEGFKKRKSPIILKKDDWRSPPLPGKDSNPHRRNQNPKCYHYTTGQFSSAKVQIYFISCTLLRSFFIAINFC